MHERGCVCVGVKEVGVTVYGACVKNVGVTVYGACVKNVGETVHGAVVTIYSE